MPPIMIVRSGVPVPAAAAPVESVAPPALLPVALLAQPARARDPTTAAIARVFHRGEDIVVSFRLGVVEDLLDSRLDQTAVKSAEFDGGRQRRMRFSSRVMSVSAVSYTHLRAHETDSYLVCGLL